MTSYLEELGKKRRKKFLHTDRQRCHIIGEESDLSFKDKIHQKTILFYSVIKLFGFSSNI